MIKQEDITRQRNAIWWFTKTSEIHKESKSSMT